jgi:hypothetical protein
MRPIMFIMLLAGCAAPLPPVLRTTPADMASDAAPITATHSRIDVSVLMETSPIEGLPRVQGEPSAMPGVVAVVVDRQAWASVRARLDEVGRLETPALTWGTVVDGAPVSFAFTSGDHLQVRVVRTGDGDEATVHVDDPRVTRRVRRGELLVLLRRVSDERAAIMAIAWEPTPGVRR